MNIYDDYGNYIEEYEELIKKLREVDSPIIRTIDDVLRVLDYVYEQYLAGDKIEEDLIDIFDIGFGYFSNVMDDLNLYLKEYFNDNFDVFNYYGKVLVYQIYLEDFRCYLDNEELLTEERKEVINEVKNDIDVILRDKLPYTQDILDEFEGRISSIMPKNENFKPVFSVFLMITEELNIF